MRTLLASWFCLLLAVAVSPAARATPATGYEAERTGRVLASLGFVEDAAPATKRIAKIHVVSHDVFAEDEPWPTFFNVFHSKTEGDVVTRELLFRAGEAWDQSRIDESMRNLRNQGIFAFVRIAPVQPVGAPSPDSVEVLVYTRDLWSLRLESSFAFTDGLINQLSLTLIERNLAGRNAQAALTFDLRPANLSLGGFFANRRLLGTRLSLSASLDFVLARDDGALEGTRGGFSFGLPLVDLRQPWGFELSAAWNASVGRQLSGADLLTWDDPGTPATEAVPRIWDQDIAQVVLKGQRQFGRALIHRFSFGYAADVAAWAPHPDTGLTPDTPEADAFTDAVLPPSREQLYPFFRWQTFTPTWKTFVELAAFGLSEDIRTGPWLNLFFGAPLKAFGSDVNALTWEASAGLVLAPSLGGDRALIDFVAALDGRLEGGEVIDQGYRVRLRGASPRFSLGRVVLLADLESRVRDTARSLVTLGGDNGLRGYASQAFYGFGADRLRLGAELRSPPLVLGSVHIGGVLFYDAGGIGDGLSDLALHHAVGLGMRLLLPQFNRFAFRFDLGFPLDADGFTAVFSLGSTQAIPLTALEDEKL